MSSLKSSNQVTIDPGSKENLEARWPTIGESVSRLGGSGPMTKSGKKSDEVLGKEKSMDSANHVELPSSYSAAVGVGNSEIQLKVTEEDGEQVGVILDESMDEIKPLWTDLLVGKFPSKYPNLKDIFDTVNKIWTLGNRNIRIEVYKVSDTLVKFRIPDKDTRERVLKRGMWSISGLPMILSKWAPIEELEEIEVKVVPIWVIIKRVPRSMFHWKGLSCLSKVVGKPIKLHPETIQCVKFDEAKILVEADLTAKLPKTHKFRSKKKGVFSVDFLYPWVPQRCTRCYKWGHSNDSCNDSCNDTNVQNQQLKQKEVSEKRNVEENVEVEQGIEDKLTYDSPLNDMRKGNIAGIPSLDIQEGTRGSELKNSLNQEKRIETGKGNTHQKEGSFSKTVGKMIITREDALEELRMVKEGLRQISPSNVSQEKFKDEMKQNYKETNEIGSPITQGKEVSNKVSGEVPTENDWKTVTYGSSSKQKEGLKGREEFSLPLSKTGFMALADSIEEMEMMVSNDDIPQEEENNEARDDESDSQEEKFYNKNSKFKQKEKEKETKQRGSRGRGRGRKPKKI